MSTFFSKNQFALIFAHLSAWCVFLSIPFLIPNQEITPTHFQALPINIILGFGSLLIGLFYINFGVLIPRILNRFGARFYALSILIVWFILIGITFIFNSLFFRQGTKIPIFAPIFPSFLVFMMSLSFSLLIDKAKKEKHEKERENETLKSELSFLRSQISPHFLFNVMNNVVALSRIQPKKVEPTLIQLSQLMRYMLYSSDEKKVSIPHEITYLDSYIDLQQLRFGDAVDVIFNKNMENTEGVHIEPMLLIPFVENAFKHGVGFVENPKIGIDISLRNNILIFTVLNSFAPLSTDTKDRDSGIGLKNVSRRLELLYGEQQELKISNSQGLFKVHLEIRFLS
ncbi:MAG: histidine kinase [Saprospiraceae bacterium]|nr:histidine kinase [Saprospiraceae bacterium]